MNMLKGHFTLTYQFTPSGPEAYIGTSGSRFKAVHVCSHSLYRLPRRRDGKLVNFNGIEGHSDIQLLTRPGIEPGTSELGSRDLTTAPTLPLVKTIKVLGFPPM